MIPQQKSIRMIIFFPVSLKHLFKKGRDYPWPKPDRCPRCNSCKVWGHGYSSGLFDGFNQPLSLRRYRCPDCRCIIKCRPKGYFKRFQAPIKTIRDSISSKERAGRWLKGISRTRQAHWFRALTRRMAAFWGHTFRQDIINGFDCLQALGQVPVSRAI